MTWYAEQPDGSVRAISIGELAKVDRSVCRTDVFPGLLVSTVFLSLDHSHTGCGRPVLWETMTFGLLGGPDASYQERYTSRAAAVSGHRRAVSAARWTACRYAVPLLRRLLADEDWLRGS